MSVSAVATLRTRSSRPLTVVERNLMQHRHSRLALLSGVFEPLMYLLSIGVGIGRLVHHVPGLEARGVSYAEFVAPALLATAAMNDALNESTNVLYSKLRLQKIYHSVLATPLTVLDVVLGETCWAMLRGLLAATGFLAFAGAAGLVRSGWAVLVLPCAALIAFAFAPAGIAVSTWIRGWQDFQYVQLVLLPMFLFATTFYPLAVYPRPLQIVVECTPLYHGIELARSLALGEFGAGVLVHVAYLVVMGVVGLWAAARRMRMAATA